MAVSKGKLTFAGGAVGVYDEVFRDELQDPDGWADAQGTGKCLVVALGGDGACQGELRQMSEPLGVAGDELAKVTDITEDCVLLCPSGRVLFVGMGAPSTIALTVPAGAVVAAVYGVGKKLVAMIAPTMRRPPNDKTLAEFGG